jgi:hypothetical protein
VLFRLHASDDASDLPVRADHERGPVNPHVLPAIHALFLEHAELLGYVLVLVREQRVGQAVFFFEFLLRGRFVGGNAQYDRTGALDFLECVAEPARLQRSTGRVSLGVEEQNHVLSAIVFQRDGLAFFIGQGELRGFIINFHGFSVLMTPMNLYRRNTVPASLVLLLACLIAFTTATAQRRRAHQLRATALVERTTDADGVVTARLIPITILDEGRFYDAGIYKATPRPMAVVPGIVYEAQKCGQPVGYVTVGNAAKDKDGAWMAPGKWEPVKDTAKSETPVPPPANAGDDRPILHRPDSSGTATPTPPKPTQVPTKPSPAYPSDYTSPGQPAECDAGRHTDSFRAKRATGSESSLSSVLARWWTTAGNESASTPTPTGETCSGFPGRGPFSQTACHHGDSGGGL